MKPNLTLYPTVYHDGASLFLEYPGSPPHAYRFPLTEGGLGKALRHIPNIAKAPGYITPGSSNLPAALRQDSHSISRRHGNHEVKIAKATLKARERAKLPSGLRDAASAVVRKMK